jgi:hypothetical protein
MDARQDQRSVVDLMTRVINEVVHLFQTEIRLVRAEMNDKASQIASGGAVLGGAVILAIAGLVIVLQGIAAGLAAAGLPVGWALFLVGIAALGLGGFLAWSGIKQFKSTSLVPDRSIGQIQADMATVRDHIS